MSSRVDEAIGNPLALWALIMEDELDGNARELGEIAERLYAGEQEQEHLVTRLRAEVHSLSGQLAHASATRPGAVAAPAAGTRA